MRSFAERAGLFGHFCQRGEWTSPMRTVARNINAALAIAALGISGGFALAAFTQNGMWPQSPLPLAGAPDPRQAAPAPWPAAQDYPPVDPYQQEAHVCRGCAPTLAERQVQDAMDRLYSEGEEVVEPEPLPPEEPVPSDEQAPTDMSAAAQVEALPSALTPGKF